MSYAVYSLNSYHVAGGTRSMIAVVSFVERKGHLHVTVYGCCVLKNPCIQKSFPLSALRYFV